MTYLPDTNTMIAWTVRGHPDVAERFRAHRSSIALSAIVVHELYYGAFNSGKVERNLRELEHLGLPILDFDGIDAQYASRIRADMRRLGTPIGHYDLLIAGQALARELTVVTNNTGEFARVAGLKLEDWTAP